MSAKRKQNATLTGGRGSCGSGQAGSTSDKRIPSERVSGGGQREGPAPVPLRTTKYRALGQTPGTIAKGARHAVQVQGHGKGKTLGQAGGSTR